MGTSELDGSGRARSGSDRAHPHAATRPGFVEPSDDVRVLRQVAWPGLTRPLDELVAAPSGLWIVEHRPWQDIAVARGRVITADADVTLDVQHLDQVRVRVARDLGLTPVESHALVVVPEEVPALRLEGVVIVGQRLVRQIILSPGRRLTPTQLDVLARRTAKVLDRGAHPDRPQAPPRVAVVPGPAHQPVHDGPHDPWHTSRAPEPSPTEPVPQTPPPAPRLTPVVPARTVAPEPAPTPVAYPSEPEPPAAFPGYATEDHDDEYHDEPPPPLPTPEELGLPPALPDPPAQQGPKEAADPIWPIAPPPGLWSEPEPEPELAQLVVETGPDEVEADESDLERTRVVDSASVVPMVDEDESEMGRTRVVDYPAGPVTPGRGLPRLVEPGVEPGGTWPELLDEPTADEGPVVPEPIAPELVAELVDAGLLAPEMLAELVEDGLVAPELVDAGPEAPGADSDDLVATGPAARTPVEQDDPDLPVGLDVVPDGGPAEVYGLAEDVELTRIRPPDRPPASQSLADARRAFFSADPDEAFGQTSPEDVLEAEPDRGRPAGTRPPARLPVAWDDDPAEHAAGPRPQVAWDPPEAPRSGARPRVAWDDDEPVPEGPHEAEPEPRYQPEPRPERRSVVAGPRPPVDHRPVERTTDPGGHPEIPEPAGRPTPAGRPARPERYVRPTRQPERPPRRRAEPAAARAAEPAPGPQPPPYAADRPGAPHPPGGSAPSHRPARPRPVRSGPWNLSPAQAAAVGGRFSGPVRIRGAFGTGRSVAAAYRAVHLAQTQPGLVAVVVPALPQVEPMLRRLASVADADVLERIVVDVPAGLARTVLAEFGTEVNLAPESVARAWSAAERSTGLGAAQGRSIALVCDEVALIRGRSLTSERDYDRLRQEMPSGLRRQVWVLHEAYLAELRRRNLPDEHDLVRMARAALRARVPSQFTAAVVDDANDLTLDQLTMVRETVGTGADALTIVDDGLPGLLPVGATLREAGIDVGQRQVDLAHEFRLTGPAWTSLVRLLQADPGHDVTGAVDRPRLAGRLDDGEGPSYLRSQAIRVRRDKLVERVAELVGEGVPPESIALLHIEDEAEPELVAELVRAGVLVRGLDALDVPGVALGRARDARGVEFDHVLVPDARHRDVVPVGGLRWDQRQRRRLLGLALSRSRETAWIAGV